MRISNVELFILVLIIVLLTSVLIVVSVENKLIKEASVNAFCISEQTFPNTIDLTVSDTRCIGLSIKPADFIGAPPRLWLCNSQDPWFDESGVRFPTIEKQDNG
jgi:hypothetical protein